MLDQSFSAKNFHTILVDENRKGNNLEKEFFEQEIFNAFTKKIRDLNKKLKININTFINKDIKGRKPNKELFKRYKKYLRSIKQKLKKEKEKKTLELLEIVSKKVQENTFKFDLDTKIFKGKTIYVVRNTPETYFTMKQLQYNFHKLYGVKQSNRFEIVNQVKCLLDDKFPKFIIRTDIKGFYENIDNRIILDKLNEDNLLSPTSKKFVKQILRDYEVISGNPKGKGIPRGIGISAYLAEYYMRRIDRKIKELHGLTYYARYVDDMIIIFTPTYEHDPINYYEKLKVIIDSEQGISLNAKKTEKINLVLKEEKTSPPYSLDFLGYKYVFQNKPKKQHIESIKIYLTDNKIRRYKDKIKLAFEAYVKYKDKNKGYRHLKNVIKFLTGNTRLVNNKSNILVGIHYSNILLTETETLNELDKYLHWYIKRYIKKDKHKEKLLLFNFESGFKEKKFYTFEGTQLKQIINIWVNL